MKRILPFEKFINEADLMKTLGAVLSGDVSAKDALGILPSFARGKAGSSEEEPETAFPGKSRIRRSSGDYELDTDYSAVPGNDDFALYMQHQQGVAGAAGIIKALNGTGQMHPDTVKTKSGVKYANLANNIPSDKPQVKKDIIAALDAGDQQTAAGLFLNVWKEKWNSYSKKVKDAIKDPKNSEAVEAIKEACSKHGVPFEFAVTVAMIESGLNPDAGNPKYKGLFAMEPSSSYGGLVRPMGANWSDPFLNADNGVRLLRRDIEIGRAHV